MLGERRMTVWLVVITIGCQSIKAAPPLDSRVVETAVALAVLEHVAHTFKEDKFALVLETWTPSSFDPTQRWRDYFSQEESAVPLECTQLLLSDSSAEKPIAIRLGSELASRIEVVASTREALDHCGRGAGRCAVLRLSGPGLCGQDHAVAVVGLNYSPPNWPPVGSDIGYYLELRNGRWVVVESVILAAS